MSTITKDTEANTSSARDIATLAMSDGSIPHFGAAVLMVQLWVRHPFVLTAINDRNRDVLVSISENDP